jgi:ABC-2 type transport system ATP-binding protein
MTEAEHLCDRVAVLYEGQLRASGPPAALVSQIGGAVRTRFTYRDSATLAGLDGLPGVQELRHDGELAELVGDSKTPMLVAAELARRGFFPPDFTVQRPSFLDVYLTLTGGAR